MSTKNLLDFPTTTETLSSSWLHISEGGEDKKISVADFISSVNGGNPFNITVREESGNNLILTLADKNAYIRCLNAVQTTVQVKNAATVGWQIGDSIIFRKEGLGNVLFASDSGVTLRGAASGLSLTEVGQAGQLICVDNTPTATVFDFVTGGNARATVTGSITFLTVAALGTGATNDGYTVDPAQLAANNTLVRTIWNNTTSKAGGDNYVIWTLAAYRTHIGNPSWVPDGIIDHYFVNTTYVAIRDRDTILSSTQLGAPTTGGANLGSVIASAAAAGISELYIPNETWTTTGSVDGQGITLSGSGRMTGGTLDNVKLKGISNRKDISIFEQKQPCKQLSGPSTNKLLHKRSDTAFSLFTRNATNDEYIYTEIEQSSDSVPALSVGAPFELMRAQHRWRCDAVVTFRDQFDAQSGGVVRLGTSLDTFFAPSGRTRVGTVSGAMDSWVLERLDWIEFNVPTSFFKEGIAELNVAYYCTSGNSEAIDITVGGDLVKTINARSGTDGSSVQVATFQAENRGGANTITVRITNNTTVSGRNCYIIGLNLYDLRDDRSSLIPDGFKAWYRTDSSYVDSNGAGDYAIRDAGSGLFCGSYHGGETSTYLRMCVGGSKTAPTSLPSNYFGVSKSIGVAQRTTITGGAGGGSYSTLSNLNYIVDGVESLRVSITLNADVSHIYTNLHPASNNFNRVLYPGDLALPGTENTQALTLNNGDIIQLDDNSSMYTRHVFTLFDSSRNTFGGPHIWNRVGTYRKVYYGPVVDNLANCSGQVLEFEYNREFGKGKY